MFAYTHMLIYRAVAIPEEDTSNNGPCWYRQNAKDVETCGRCEASEVRDYGVNGAACAMRPRF